MNIVNNTKRPLKKYSDTEHADVFMFADAPARPFLRVHGGYIDLGTGGVYRTVGTGSIYDREVILLDATLTYEEK